MSGLPPSMIHDARDLLSDRRRKYYSPADVAEYLGVSRSFVYQLIERGDLEANRFGKTVRVPKDEILRYERDTRLSWQNGIIPRR